MREVQATEAKAHLAQLLRAVEHGETVAITRHGKTVAHLVPAQERDLDNQKLAVEHFRAWRRQRRRIEMSTEEILSSIHEGHRW